MWQLKVDDAVRTSHRAGLVSLSVLVFAVRLAPLVALRPAFAPCLRSVLFLFPRLSVLVFACLAAAVRLGRPPASWCSSALRLPSGWASPVGFGFGCAPCISLKLGARQALSVIRYSRLSVSSPTAVRFCTHDTSIYRLYRWFLRQASVFFPQLALPDCMSDVRVCVYKYSYILH